MSLEHTLPLMKRPDVLWVDVDGEVVLYEPDSGRAHLLSSSGSLLWPAFSSPVTAEELAADVAAAFDLPLSEAADQVRTFCEQLLQIGALETVDMTDPPA